MSIQQKSSIELMNMYAEILAELNSRNVVRTYNSPVGDYAEWLVAEMGAWCCIGTKQRAERDQKL